MAIVAIAAAFVGAVIGAVVGDLQWKDEVAEGKTELERARLHAERKIKEATAANQLQGGQAVDVYAEELRTGRETEALTKKQAEEAYQSGLTSNVAQQGETRRRANVQALDVQQQGLVSTGAQTATLAGSGLRKTGTASALISERGRMYGMDIGKIDRELEAEVARHERGREQLALGKEQIFEQAEFDREQDRAGAETTLEHTLEDITGKPVDWGPGMDLDFTPSFLVDDWNEQLGWMAKDLADLQGQQGRRMLVGAFGGLDWGLPFL